MDNMTIHSSRYTASLDKLNNILLVSYNRNGHGGVFLQGNDAIHWSNEIKTAIDKHEADELCRFLVKSTKD